VINLSSQASSLCRSLDQFVESLESGLFLFGADDVPFHHFPIRRRLRLKELPRRLVSFEFPGVRFDQLRTSLLVGINARSVFFSQLVCFQPGRQHSFIFDKSFDVANVDTTPDAVRFARRESNHITVFIDALANAVDPSEAQSFIDRLGPGDAWLAGTLFVEADPKLFRFGMISPEPFAERGRGFEKFKVQRGFAPQERHVYSTAALNNSKLL